MCSIILRIEEGGVFIAANRDEMLNRPWAPPGKHWPKLPGVIAGQDKTAGGSWLGLNRDGVMAGVLNRHGSLGPAPGKRSRGELPLLALAHPTAEAAVCALARLDAGAYRSFNLVIADCDQAFCLSGLERGVPVVSELGYGTWMITSGEPNEMKLPRIARHLPKFEATEWENWNLLLADNTAPVATALNIPPHNGFATVSASLMALPKDTAPSWDFAAGPPHEAAFLPVALHT
ncbi:MAG: NRDE family protein [Acidocella sp.]|nr:NRDE family protein [Acidocella sp.]